MICMAKVDAIFTKKRGRFVLLELENMPKLPWIRFIVPSLVLQLGDRVKITIETKEGNDGSGNTTQVGERGA